MESIIEQKYLLFYLTNGKNLGIVYPFIQNIKGCHLHSFSYKKIFKKSSWIMFFKFLWTWNITIKQLSDEYKWKKFRCALFILYLIFYNFWKFSYATDNIHPVMHLISARNLIKKITNFSMRIGSSFNILTFTWI